MAPKFPNAAGFLCEFNEVMIHFLVSFQSFLKSLNAMLPCVIRCCFLPNDPLLPLFLKKGPNLAPAWGGARSSPSTHLGQGLAGRDAVSWLVRCKGKHSGFCLQTCSLMKAGRTSPPFTPTAFFLGR